jgi:hypothetical protein
MSTDEIDDLKDTSTQSDPTKDPQYSKFFANFAVSTAGILVFVALGAIGLYFTKIAAAKIIPTNIEFKPYTCTPNPDPEKKPEVIMMNLVREFPFKGLGIWMPAISKFCQQAKFDEKSFDKSFKGSRMRSLWEAQDEETNKAKGIEVSNFARWKSESMNKMISAGFSFIQTVFGAFSGWNETLFMLLFGMLGSIFFPIFMIVNVFTSIWAHISALAKKGVDGSLHTGVSWLKRKTRKENGETDFEEPPASIFKVLGLASKKEPDDITWVENILFVLKFILFYMLISIYFMVSSLLVSPIYTTFYTIFKTVGIKYKLKLEDDFSSDDSGSGDSTLKGMGNFIRDSFAYKRTYLVALSIVNLLMQANIFLGTYYFAAIFISIILAIVFCDIFVSKKSPGDNTQIPMDPDTDSKSNDDDELDAEDEGDECDNNKDAIQKIQAKISDLVYNNKDSLHNTQSQSQDLLKQAYLCCNDKVKIDAVTGIYTKEQLTELQKMDGFQKLNEDVNNLAKQYFNGADFGKKSLLLDTSDPEEIQVQKLNAQLKYLQKYVVALQTANKQCKDSLLIFSRAEPIEDIKKGATLTAAKIDTFPGNPFFLLMKDLQKAETAIYQVRPTIIDIITKSIEENKTNKDTSAPKPDLTLGVPKDNSLLSKIGINTTKNNLKYNETFMELESTIGKLMTTVFGNKDVFIDIIIAPSPEVKKSITDYNNFIIKALALIKDEPVFKKTIAGLNLDLPNPTLGTPLISGGGKKNHSRRNHKTQAEPIVTKEYNIRLV